MAAALELFVEKGFVGTRLDDVAARAGVSKGTLYLYFDSKEALFLAMVRDALVTPMRSLQELITQHPDDSATQLLTTLMHGWWSRVRSERYGVIARLVIGELHQFPELVEAYNVEVIARGRAALADIIRHGISTGEFRPIEPRTAARMIASMAVANGLWASHRTLFTEMADQSDDDVVDAIVDFSLAALRAPASASTR